MRTITTGITKTGVAVEWVDLSVADPHEIRELVNCAAGIVIGMPPQSSQTTVTQVNFSTILATASSRQLFGLFETGGGKDEPIYPLRAQLRGLGLVEAFPPIVVKGAATAVIDQLCDEAGTDLGQRLSAIAPSNKAKPSNLALIKPWAG